MTSLNVRPAIIILCLFALAFFVPEKIAPRTAVHFMGMFVGMVLCAVSTLVWWIFRSKATGLMRWLPPVIFLACMGLSFAFYFKKENAMIFFFFTAAAVAAVWCLVALLTSATGWNIQRVLIILSLLACLALTYALRIDGTTADLTPEVSWRWNATPEQLAIQSNDGNKPKANIAKAENAVIKLTNDDWPQFRGANQESRVVGVNIRTDWDKNPPKEVWRKRVGPGWGSMAVIGDLLYTQEQRGENESTVCLKADTGEEVWRYETVGRFDESISGAGPRATPTYHDGYIYTFGATGKLTKLNALTGEKAWEIDTKKSTDSSPPKQFWGFASSPFISNGLVVVCMTGGDGKGTAAFKLSDGSLAWTGGNARHGYCTAQQVTIAGVEQLLMPSDIGIESLDPTTGQVLWTHLAKIQANRSTQAIMLSSDELMLTTGYSIGSQRLQITKNNGQWKVEKKWDSKGLKPYYNDAVFHNGLVFGFDDRAFVCFDPNTGKQRWNEGAIYGLGQLLLVANQGILIVQAENGQVALVEASGDAFNEIAKVPALKNKTWNHPVLSRNKLYLRNSQEIISFDLK